MKFNNIAELDCPDLESSRQSRLGLKGLEENITRLTLAVEPFDGREASRK
jgi:hypothetical protein